MHSIMRALKDPFVAQSLDARLIWHRTYCVYLVELTIGADLCSSPSIPMPERYHSYNFAFHPTLISLST